MALATTVVLLLAVVAGCGSGDVPGDAGRIDAELVADLAPGDARAVGEAVNTFGFELFNEVAGGTRENTVTSPLSMSVLLAMLLAGAGGETSAEIGKVLHLQNPRDVRVSALLRELADTDDVTLAVANSLWADEGRPFEKDYLDFLERAFGATLDERDLGSPDVVKEIDKWASDNTEGRIDRIAEDLGLPNADAVLVLLNAVYFLGDWKTQFDPANTRPAPFTGVGDVPTMHLSGEKFGYAERDGFRMLRLPYGEDGRYGMEIMLPDENVPPKEMTAASWRAAVDSLTEETIDELTLPKFELRWKAELVEPLRRLGITAAFDPAKADFHPMSPQAPWLSAVVQKTYIRVDEKGTEAAAVSGGTMATSALVGQREFRVDRPFTFTISDTRTGTILFLGSVTDPRS
ncbi:serpin family protein [Actinoplanes sp. NPDC051861]|uniref:serpin family protein n=1 Tax=Actinoplanes sp. NPDC051861 TaxID=3155170 RepID=UPI003414E575